MLRELHTRDEVSFTYEDSSSSSECAMTTEGNLLHWCVPAQVVFTTTRERGLNMEIHMARVLEASRAIEPHLLQN